MGGGGGGGLLNQHKYYYKVVLKRIAAKRHASVQEGLASMLLETLQSMVPQN